MFQSSENKSWDQKIAGGSRMHVTTRMGCAVPAEIQLTREAGQYDNRAPGGKITGAGGGGYMLFYFEFERKRSRKRWSASGPSIRNSLSKVGTTSTGRAGNVFRELSELRLNLRFA
jgi:galactokinase/mevalonate kinase-like predicted kinase